MNYEKIYNALILKRQTSDVLPNTGVYTEVHHIIPRSVGGSNAKSNLVTLTAREHLIAHKLLKKIFLMKYGRSSDEYRKMVTALFFMVNVHHGSTKRTVTSREYSRIKENFAYVNSMAISGEKHWNYGKHWNAEVRDKISRANKGKKVDKSVLWKWAKYGSDNPNYGHKWSDEQKAAASKLRAGKPLSDETKRKLREYWSTHDSPMKGVNVRDRMTKENYEKMLQKRSSSMKAHFANGGARINPYAGKTAEELLLMKEHQILGHRRRWENMTPEEREVEREKKRRANRLSLESRRRKKEELIASGCSPVKRRWFNDGHNEVLSETQPDGYNPGRLYKLKNVRHENERLEKTSC